jgi:hypothetical protein
MKPTEPKVARATSAPPRRGSAPPAPAPRAFDVRAGRGGWEVVGDSGKPISLHAALLDAIALAVLLAKRCGAEVFVDPTGGARRRVLAGR